MILHIPQALSQQTCCLRLPVHVFLGKVVFALHRWKCVDRFFKVETVEQVIVLFLYGFVSCILVVSGVSHPHYVGKGQ